MWESESLPHHWDYPWVSSDPWLGLWHGSRYIGWSERTGSHMELPWWVFHAPGVNHDGSLREGDLLVPLKALSVAKSAESMVTLLCALCLVQTFPGVFS